MPGNTTFAWGWGGVFQVGYPCTQENMKTFQDIFRCRWFREMVSWSPSSIDSFSENCFCYISFSILTIRVPLLLDQGRLSYYPTTHSEPYCAVLSQGASLIPPTKHYENTRVCVGKEAKYNGQTTHLFVSQFLHLGFQQN